ncbi:MAG: hypothetical protein C5S48_10105 [Candidatus Methanogaster sp.]|nr:MAG: hypothetical protein C5S48_10105 [ANME-2 cluster archaeon]
MLLGWYGWQRYTDQNRQQIIGRACERVCDLGVWGLWLKKNFLQKPARIYNILYGHVI